MSRRHKPPCISNIGQFEADMTTASNLILEYAHGVRVTSRHYWPLQELHIKLVQTMQTVTGMEVPWVRNRGVYPEKPQLD